MLQPLAQLPLVQELKINGRALPTDLAFLTRLPELRHLYMSKYEVRLLVRLCPWLYVRAQRCIIGGVHFIVYAPAVCWSNFGVFDLSILGWSGPVSSRCTLK